MFANHPAMKLIYNPVFLEHDTGMHPENRKRLEALGELPESEITTDGTEYLPLIHTPDYIKTVKEACPEWRHLDADTATSPWSYKAAVNAVGATVMAARQGDFAIVRPPGHHAYAGHASGFCLFNNVSIAAKMLAGEGKRILIFDFDGHLGDGTAHLFYDTDQVMYVSIHQYPAFPGHGFVHEIGEGKGKGFTINIPLPPDSGDDIFMHAFNNFLPVMVDFQPDVVAISAGFDAHLYDLLLQLRVTAGSFFQLGKALRENFPVLFATLEGGYNIQELPRCLFNFQAGINGAEIPFLEPETSSRMQVWQEYEARIQAVMNNLSPYWQF